MERYPQQCIIEWTGYSTSKSSAQLSHDYSKGQLNIGIYVYGTPVMGYACDINVRALNFQFKSGGTYKVKEIYDTDFNKDRLLDVTPESAYEGKQLNFLVSIEAHPDSVLYARVGW
ncbi:MAG: hypothetical protein NC180_00965 [Muribaculaceae bacterium]|nr:hypothetical protein [Roseburia sp.]MCM1431342.1 hypothetical protein [Muribaculaceae bacterium]MCM1491784.1 hypothetical protein [Muribaculaceae bacterium]